MNEKVYEAALGLLKLLYFKKENRRNTKRNKLQTLVLQTVFNMTNYPSASTQIDLAILLKMQIKSVRIWFQNARQQRKKKMLGDKIIDNNEIIDVPIPFILEMIKEYNK